MSYIYIQRSVLIGRAFGLRYHFGCITVVAAMLLVVVRHGTDSYAIFKLLRSASNRGLIRTMPIIYHN